MPFKKQFVGVCLTTLVFVLFYSASLYDSRGAIDKKTGITHTWGWGNTAPSMSNMNETTTKQKKNELRPEDLMDVVSVT